MYTKEDFNKVWKDSTREDILNQFYYEHNDFLFSQDDYEVIVRIGENGR